MQFSSSTAEVFVPDGVSLVFACERITHLGIGAHSDDLEFMAFHGIIACHDHEAGWFGGVTCGDGAGSARSGVYAAMSDTEMRAVRRGEQNRAAQIGRYGVMVHLDHPSKLIQDPDDVNLCGDLTAILRATRPRVIYTHNLADKHDTHIGVAVAAIQAMRALPPGERPERVHGCEVWRTLDWMLDHEKIIQNLSGHEFLAEKLNGVFDSQIAGGKRYDLGVSGRRRANATFLDPRAVDGADSIAFAMDLTPLVRDDTLDITEYVDGFVSRFRADVRGRLNGRLGH